MKIFRIGEINQSIKNVLVYSLEEFVSKISLIKMEQMNVISIRDSARGQSQHNKELYATIDAQKFENIYIAFFDDFETNEEQIEFPKTFPKKSQVHDILNWAKTKWEENHKPFAIHCTGGVSRSSSVAILISQMIQNNYNDVFNPKFHSPNKKVLEYGEEYLGQQGILKDVSDKVKKYDEENKNFIF